MASEYKKRGGDYNTDKKDQDDSQKNLSKWGEEEWQTKEGSGHAKKSDGTQKRYLPKKAWEEMSEGEKEQTDRKKQEGGKEGKQFVANTGKARKARKAMSEKEEEGKDEGGQDEQNGEENDEEEEETGAQEKENDDEDEETGAQENKEEEKTTTKSTRGRKRKTDEQPPSSDPPSSKKTKSSSSDSSSKSKKKTMGSKHDPSTPPAQQATTTRLPKKGQQVHWKAMPGWVKGTVIQIARKDGSTEGKSYKASKTDPTIVLRAESGKVCAHKAKSVYFD